ncbi:hypothetical protein C2G38_2130223, partial [Gigaspora rosea]
MSQNQKIFHAVFLDGIRGVAALCVIYEHSQRFYNQSLPFTTFNYVGYLGVRCFFVLSAFLLTFRSMLDWERYHENIEDEKYIDTNARNRCVFESKIDLEADLPDVPLLSKMTEISSKKTNYIIFYKFLFYIRSIIWIKHKIAIKLWLKFFLRRFMRVYPPYAILLPIIAYNNFIKRAYHERINPSNLVSHLFLQEAKFTFWTIPPEMKYYLCIPIIVIGYVELARFGAYLTNYLYGRPKIGAWISRILCNIILMIIRTELLSLYGNYHNRYLTTNAHIFLVGSICSIWYREIIRLGLLPMSSKEEKVLVNKSNNLNEITHTNLNFMKLIIYKLPIYHQLIRSFFDLGCYITLFIIFCTFPHLSEKILGMPHVRYESYEVKLENSFGGFLYAILILLGLLS